MEPGRRAANQAVPEAGRSPGADRRSRRRQETIEEILDIAVQVMAEEGVAGLSLSEVARRIGIQPPSLYKYFPSRLAVYDALFERGARTLLAVFRTAAGQAEPGWAALTAGLEAIMRLGLDHQAVGQLLNTRPVPGFEPSPEAFAPSLEFVNEVHGLLQVAVERGELHPDAASEEGESLLSVLVAGVMTQQLANEPHASFQQGRFTRLTPQVLELFRSAFPPERGER